jgi:hypothetical protein
MMSFQHTKRRQVHQVRQLPSRLWPGYDRNS